MLITVCNDEGMSILIVHIITYMDIRGPWSWMPSLNTSSNVQNRLMARGIQHAAFT